MEEFAATLSKENFTRTVVMTRHKEPRVYWCFGKNMMLKHWRKFRIVISYDNEKLEGEPYFLISNKTNWVQAQKISSTVHP
ncbi:MAG: hypothetical protein K8F91_01465, partial [Candidatus Obscuribacterales bacterium]|nr:hypothetical protein [Candidatus Obscuribacterales bacterium]